MSKVKVETFIADVVSELEEQNVAIFAGAGLSVPAGFVDWKGLLKPLADELNLDLEQEIDLVRVAQYHVNLHSNRSDLTNAVLNNFAQRQTKVTENHRILARLPITTYWTTNYDSCIEDALKAGGKLPDVKYTSKQLLTTVRGRGAVVYKMHGDYQHADDAVLCKEDYETYHINRGDFLIGLAGDLLSKMFLFIGFSFSDPNMDYVLSRMFTRYGKHQRKHYCFVREERQRAQDKPGEFDYRKAKQELFIRDLERYNIRVVMVQEYSDITTILRQVESRYKSRTIFVSGAVHEYGRELSERDALQLVHRFGKDLIEQKYRVVTGLGLGIGSTLLDGMLQQILHVDRTAIGDQLIIRPFPQTGGELKKLWTEYRKDMLDHAGMAVFMFGNKLAGDPPSLVTSDGMVEEFEIAVSKGIKVLPLGFTGYAARGLYNRVDADKVTYYPKATPRFLELFALLGDASRPLGDQQKTVLEALGELQGM
jgi:hypothetical protein